MVEGRVAVTDDTQLFKKKFDQRPQKGREKASNVGGTQVP